MKIVLLYLPVIELIAHVNWFSYTCVIASRSRAWSNYVVYSNGGKPTSNSFCWLAR